MASASYSNAPSYSVLAEENALLREQLQVMQRQLDWFKKQLFGPKSEKQVYDLPEQGGLFQSNDAASPEKPLDAEKRPVRKETAGRRLPERYGSAFYSGRASGSC